MEQVRLAFFELLLELQLLLFLLFHLDAQVSKRVLEQLRHHVRLLLYRSLEPQPALTVGIDELDAHVDRAAFQREEADVYVWDFKDFHLLTLCMDEEGTFAVVGTLIPVFARLFIVLRHENGDIIQDLLVCLRHCVGLLRRLGSIAVQIASVFARGGLRCPVVVVELDCELRW